MCTNKVIDFDNLSDEELDAFFRPRKTNGDKTLTALFVYLILKEHSHKGKHLLQKEILDYLAEYPYDLVIERKALSRCIHLLSSLHLDIYSDPRYGTWIDQEPGERSK